MKDSVYDSSSFLDSRRSHRGRERERVSFAHPCTFLGNMVACARAASQPPPPPGMRALASRYVSRLVRHLHPRRRHLCRPQRRPCEGGAYAYECGELRQLRASMLTKGEREWSRHFTLCDMLGRGGDGGFCQMLIPSSAASLNHPGRGLTGSDSQVFLPVG